MPPHMRTSLGLIFGCALAISTGCDNGAVSAPLPLYEGGTFDTGTFVVTPGVDAAGDGARLDGSRDSAADGRRVGDASHDVTVHSDASADAAKDVTPDAAKDVAPDASPDAATDASPDAATDAHGLADSAAHG